MSNLEIILEGLGKRIKKARIRRNIKAEELASDAGISLKTLCSIEKGISTVTIGAYVEVLRVLDMEKDLDKVAIDEEGKEKYIDSIYITRKRVSKKRK